MNDLDPIVILEDPEFRALFKDKSSEAEGYARMLAVFSRILLAHAMPAFVDMHMSHTHAPDGQTIDTRLGDLRQVEARTQPVADDAAVLTLVNAILAVDGCHDEDHTEAAQKYAHACLADIRANPERFVPEIAALRAELERAKTLYKMALERAEKAEAELAAERELRAEHQRQAEAANTEAQIRKMADRFSHKLEAAEADLERITQELRNCGLSSIQIIKVFDLVSQESNATFAAGAEIIKLRNRVHELELDLADRDSSIAGLQRSLNNERGQHNITKEKAKEFEGYADRRQAALDQLRTDISKLREEVQSDLERIVTSAKGIAAQRDKALAEIAQLRAGLGQANQDDTSHRKEDAHLRSTVSRLEELAARLNAERDKLLAERDTVHKTLCAALSEPSIAANLSEPSVAAHMLIKERAQVRAVAANLAQMLRHVAQNGDNLTFHVWYEYGGKQKIKATLTAAAEIIK